MKKYLMTGAAALALAFVNVGCSSDSEVYNPNAAQEKLAKNYSDAFVKSFAKPAASQTWGFGETTRTTRTVDVNSNEWAAKGYNVPSAISDSERQVVMEWFATNKNPTSQTVDIHDYFVQNVGHGGVSYHCVDNNGAGHDAVGSNQMDWIFCGPGAEATAWNDPTPKAYTWNNGDEHINNFNANSGVIQHILYTGSEYFGFHDSFQDNGQGSKYSTINRNFVLRFIKVDGVWGCYVGFDYESHGNQGDINPDGYFNDRVIKLIPGKGDWNIEEEEDKVVASGRVFCEDLGAIGDFDFNDVVFDAYIYESGKIDIEVFAAGGTLPISVAGNAITLGKMMNTGVNSKDETQKIYVSAETAAANNWTTIKSIPIVVSQTNGAGDVILEAEQGQAPQKICVPLGTKWADEYVSIENAYPNFVKWVKAEVSLTDCFQTPVAAFVDKNLENNDAAKSTAVVR